jgi:folate-dependent phosphoribosylglycinamide formyltransferase PurN
MVTAGFMCSIGPATVTATKTANAHPAVITIHPELLPLVFSERRLRLPVT